MTNNQIEAFAKIAKEYAAVGHIAEAKAIYYAVMRVQNDAMFNQAVFSDACGLTPYHALFREAAKIR